MDKEKEPETALEESPAPGNVDWESRFKGLQAALEKEKKAHAATKDKLSGTVGQMTDELQGLRDQMNKLVTERDTFGVQVNDLLKQKGTLEADAATSRKKLTQLQKIAKANPTLLEDFESGLIRTDLDPEGEAFDTYLAKYAERFGSVMQQAKKDALQGASTPGGSARTPAPTSDEIWKQATEALVSGDRDKYNSLMDSYYQASKPK